MLAYETTLGATLEELAQAQGDRIGLHFRGDGTQPGRQVGYGTFAAEVGGLAAELAAIAGAGERALIVAPPGELYTRALWACLHAGVAAVPVHPPDPSVPASLAAARVIAEDADVSAVLAPAGWHAHIGPLVPKAPLIDPGTPRAHPGTRAPQGAPDAPAVLLYTSGSTGAPKGVVLTHGNLLHNARVMAERTGATAEDRFCLWLPPFHVSGLFSGLVLPIAVGAAVTLFSPLAFAAAPGRWMQEMSETRATMSGAPTFAYDLCAQAVREPEVAGLDLSAWRIAVVGGEAVRADALDRFVARFRPVGFNASALFPMYGLTECTMIATGSRHPDGPVQRAYSRVGLETGVARAPEPGEEPLTLVESGAALTEMAVRIVDPELGEPLAPERVGEICIAGASVAAGYWRRPEVSQSTFGLELDGRPFLRTGDLGFLRDGVLTVTGRAKEMIIIRGLNHYPEDLERTVQTTDARVAAAAAVSVPGLHGEEELAIAIEVAEPLDTAGEMVLHGNLRAAIAHEHGVQVAGFVVLPPQALPRTVTRKIQRRRCAAAIASGEWPLRGNVQKQLMRPWPRYDGGELAGYVARLMAVAAGSDASAADPDAPLGRWGLDSLVLVRLAVHLQDALQRPVPVSLLLQASTPAALADALAVGAEIDPQAGFDPELESDPRLDTTQLSALRRAPDRPRRFLITGATGFLGRRLLTELLADADATVTCVVRAKSAAHARERIVRELPPTLAARVTALAGELSAPRWGQPAEEWDRLAHEIDAIVLCGASVNFVSPYRLLRGVNVEATRTGIALATTAVRKPVHFVSTVGVWSAAGRERLPKLIEDARPRDWRDVFGGYAQSKWVAERMLERAAWAGVPVAVYRAGLIGGDAAGGDPNLDDFVSRLLRGCVELESFPDVDIALEWVPADFVARAVAHLTATGATGTFQLVNPAPASVPEVFAALAARGYTLAAAGLAEWLARLAAAPASNALYPLLPFLAEPGTRAGLTFLELFTQGPCPGFGTARADAALAPAGITCPPLDDELISTYLTAYTRVGWLPSVPSNV